MLDFGNSDVNDINWNRNAQNCIAKAYTIFPKQLNYMAKRQYGSVEQ